MENGIVKEFLASRFVMPDQSKTHAHFQALAANMSSNPNQSRDSKVKSTTTIFALKSSDFAIIAADRQTSYGYYGVFSRTSTKITRLTWLSMMAMCGMCSTGDSIEEDIKTMCGTFEALYGQTLSVSGQAKYIKRLLQNWWWIILFFYELAAVPILAAFDQELGQPRIFFFEDDSFLDESKMLVGNGCGFRDVRALIKSYWRPDMTREAAVHLAVRALIHSGDESHGVSDSRFFIPTIFVINKDGHHPVDEKEIKAYVDLVRAETPALQEGLYHV